MALPFPALGQDAFKRAELATVLLEQHGETPADLGIDKRGGVVELFKSKDGETWTLIITFPTGLSYFLAAGQNWQPTPKGSPL